MPAGFENTPMFLPISYNDGHQALITQRRWAVVSAKLPDDPTTGDAQGENTVTMVTECLQKLDLLSDLTLRAASRPCSASRCATKAT